MRDSTKIYCLTEPGTKIIRYIGKADNINRRLKEHILAAKNGEKLYVSCWIQKLLKAGQLPDIHILCEVPQNDFEIFERAFITIGRQYGLRLTNLTDGGDGKKHLPETCAKLSAALKGKKKSPEHTARSSAARKGMKLSPEHRVKLSAACFGKKHKDNTSGFVGVRRDKKKWSAIIKTRHVGNFSKIEDAVFARNLVIANLL